MADIASVMTVLVAKARALLTVPEIALHPQADYGPIDSLAGQFRTLLTVPEIARHLPGDHPMTFLDPDECWSIELIGRWGDPRIDAAELPDAETLQAAIADMKGLAVAADRDPTARRQLAGKLREFEAAITAAERSSRQLAEHDPPNASRLGRAAKMVQHFRDDLARWSQAQAGDDDGKPEILAWG